MDGTVLAALNNYECDDGNNVSGRLLVYHYIGDGCSDVCRIETGWTCSGGNETSASTCTEICGDGIRFFAACDDENTNDGDG